MAKHTSLWRIYKDNQFKCEYAVRRDISIPVIGQVFEITIVGWDAPIRGNVLRVFQQVGVCNDAEGIVACYVEIYLE